MLRVVPGKAGRRPRTVGSPIAGLGSSAFPDSSILGVSRGMTGNMSRYAEEPCPVRTDASATSTEAALSEASLTGLAGVRSGSSRLTRVWDSCLRCGVSDTSPQGLTRMEAVLLNIVSR